MTDSFPSRALDKIVIRAPDGMRDRIRRAAESANRSMNAEIVSTLEAVYPPEPDRQKLMNELETVRAMARGEDPDWKLQLEIILDELKTHLNESVGE